LKHKAIANTIKLPLKKPSNHSTAAEFYQSGDRAFGDRQGEITNCF
jgi:hypothetical protein